MSLPSRSPALLKTLALVSALGGLLYAGHAWVNVPDQQDTSAPRDTADQALAAPPASHANPSSAPGRLSAQEVAQAYARAPQEADARFKGQRLSLQGRVDQTEAGQGQVLLITLGAGEGHAGLRAVVDMGTQAGHAPGPVAGQAVSLDCLNQGLLMGEPVLSDCRLLR
ncbi:MAG: hypothetical protein EOP36_11570 [Rubrivivax sp.]|nr:MAG: hypothetical protein EOP36_11570 [Rubrivivax sp.]